MKPFGTVVVFAEDDIINGTEALRTAILDYINKRLEESGDEPDDEAPEDLRAAVNLVETLRDEAFIIKTAVSKGLQN